MYTNENVFQSTFPLQGTTHHISACDLIFVHFNPRSHCRERREPFLDAQLTILISIHVPIAGNDTMLCSVHRIHHISIHVPIAGNDSS